MFTRVGENKHAHLLVQSGVKKKEGEKRKRKFHMRQKKAGVPAQHKSGPTGPHKKTKRRGGMHKGVFCHP